MKAIERWLNRLADNVMAYLMAAMFAVFILQIVTRYLAKYQIASDFTWTLDFCSSAMVWIIFFGGAFAMAESDHVKFDMIYNLFGPSTKRIVSIFTNLSIAAIFAVSMPAIWKWMSFLVRMGKSNPTLKLPFTGAAIPVWAIYSIYVAFAAAIIARCLWRSLRLMGGADADRLDVPHDTASAPISTGGSPS
jgi:C4-dicarboxylate transporter, DctQ subunit